MNASPDASDSQLLKLETRRRTTHRASLPVTMEAEVAMNCSS
jgi:hypothetical protein